MTIKEITDAIGGKLICGDNSYIVNSITTDSRETDNSLFLALKGEKFDGNDFAEKYLEKYDSCIVSKQIPPIQNKNIIYTTDTLKALRMLAIYYRSKFNIPFVGITGSVGKTSTRGMIYSVLSQKFSTHQTIKNFNNEIGVPLTIFKLDRKHETAVLEMGMSALGEISRLTSIVKPNIAVITNIGTAHIGMLKSQENILKAKLEILEGLNKEGIVILNGDDKLLQQAKEKIPFKTQTYGIENKDCTIFAKNIVSDENGSKFSVNINHIDYDFKINVVGIHHIYNALAAILTGINLNVPIEKIILGVFKYENKGMRQNIIKLNDITLIEDCYNASSVSMNASLKVLKTIAGENRSIAVLGDVLEQGDFSKQIHEEIGKFVVQNSIDSLVAIGNDAKYYYEIANNKISNAFYFKTNDDAYEFLKRYIKPCDTILFKGSRGMKLEEISQKLVTLMEDGK